jgi:hypothetical protein
MAWKNEGLVLPKVTASAIGQYVCVQNDTTTDSQVFVAGSCNVDAIGVSQASVPTYGLSIGVQVDKVAKILVAASVGAGARVMVASANGGIGPAIYPAAAPSGAAAGRVFSIGVIQEARNAGEYATVNIDPREIV